MNQNIQTKNFQFDSIKDALSELKKGKVIIVLDDEKRENEGDFICAAEFASPENINLMAQKGKGLICMPVSKEIADRLELFPMTSKNTDNHETAFTVSIDHKNTTTGISAYDRSLTAKKFSDKKSKPKDFRKPGHMFPLIAKDGGVLERNGHTEATVDLCRLSGLNPAGICCEIMSDDGHMAKIDELFEIAKNLKLKIISINDLIHYRKQNETIIKKEAQTVLPTKYGTFNIAVYKNIYSKLEHVALWMGKIDDSKPVLCRIHSECMTGDTFGSLKCDCGQQLETALKMIGNQKRGVLLYLRQEGRGIGLINKLKAYALQEKGFDTVDANLKLGFESDLRDYTDGIQILKDLKVSKIKLMTNNPDKIDSMQVAGSGIKLVERIPLEIKSNSINQKYLMTKKIRMGHLIFNI
ncbi:bifunctional 3,4-dihydroxy-2-butanone-4-phosphate synthase/GTP cyclohydrolase II [Treponema sp.]|uniref:bifunctional 3,4-dihydroxy-2-butanone-4-phosphate synthase/GTP cyclohydrolase II n=1 Tax=Treponema sp. TaxID=166 RepID=UPI00298E378B|nr:bifunctional 3,4-dihydroxy-2-butanone-4-phosphate synthase/GTP cyclohydrolase II [Treponema sp.]MCR5613936.1 bifunctional 3,4-dihydroxy-2-butanone-4-phosphate synthase/GTP cyclohydrolase II [Treponema sp.]